MVGAALPALAIAGTAFGAVTSVAAAQQQNRAVRRSVDSARKAAAVQEAQLAGASDAELARRRRETDRIRGRARVAFAESGFTDGSLPTMTQIDVDQSMASSAIGTNRTYGNARIRSDRDAQIVSFQSRYQNPVLSAFMGGLQGLQAGLAIGSAAQSISTAMSPAPVTPSGVYGPEISSETFYSKIKGGM